VRSSRTPLFDRKAQPGSGRRRELIVAFGASGYVLSHEIVGPAEWLCSWSGSHWSRTTTEGSRGPLAGAIAVTCAMRLNQTKSPAQEPLSYQGRRDEAL
jgi:hypothetical protein